MGKSWAVTKTYTSKGETYIADRTVVYADDLIEATRLGQEALGTVAVQVGEIPDADIPTDQEINDLQAYLRQQDSAAANPSNIQPSGGGAYGS